MPLEDPQPSFQFDGFWVEKLSFEQVERTPLEEGERKPRGGIECNLQPAAKLAVNEEMKAAELTLRFIVTPDPKWQPYRIEVVVTGRFSFSAGTMEQFVQFCQKGAASILFPFVRERIYQVTRDGRHGVVRINPINLQVMLQWRAEPDFISNEPELPFEQSPDAVPQSAP